MIGFYILGGTAIAIFLAMWVFDFGWRCGHAAGLREAQEQAEKSFEQGKRASDNWWIAADVGAEAERRAIWREEEST